MRAIVVDDSRAMRSILKKILASIGYEVVEAGHGIEALSVLSTVPDVDVALVDWNMPEMDGLELVKHLRADHKYADMRILMVSAENDMAKVARALMVGADEYAMKPVTKEMILEKLDLMNVGS